MNRTTIRPNLDVADQPTAEELAALKAEGYRAVVNLRAAGEPDQPLDPTVEGEVAREAGLEYLNVPIGGPGPLEDEQVDAVSAFLGRHPDGKVLLHCKLGGRAAALALLHLARTEGWPADVAIERGREAGLTLPPKLAEKVEAYLNR